LVYFVNKLYEYTTPDESGVLGMIHGLPVEINGEMQDVRCGKPWTGCTPASNSVNNAVCSGREATKVKRG